jgi:hypothetical protein
VTHLQDKLCLLLFVFVVMNAWHAECAANALVGYELLQVLQSAPDLTLEGGVEQGGVTTAVLHL